MEWGWVWERCSSVRDQAQLAVGSHEAREANSSDSSSTSTAVVLDPFTYLLDLEDVPWLQGLNSSNVRAAAGGLVQEVAHEIDSTSILYVTKPSQLLAVAGEAIPHHLCLCFHLDDEQLLDDGVAAACEARMKQLLTTRVSMLAFEIRGSGQAVSRLLTQLPQSSTLRHLRPASNTRSKDITLNVLLQALQSSACQVDALVLEEFGAEDCALVAQTLLHDDHESAHGTAQLLRHRIRSLGFMGCDGVPVTKVIQAVTRPDSSISELSFFASILVEEDNSDQNKDEKKLEEKFKALGQDIKQEEEDGNLELARPANGSTDEETEASANGTSTGEETEASDVALLLAALKKSSATKLTRLDARTRLTRLDDRTLDDPINLTQLKMILDTVLQTQHAIQDLGIALPSKDTAIIKGMHLLTEALHQEGAPHIQALRLLIPSDFSTEAADQLVNGILTSQESHVGLLELQIYSDARVEGLASLWRARKLHHRFHFLTIYHSSDALQNDLDLLRDFLRSEDCPLLALEILSSVKREQDKDAEMTLAKALGQNFVICHFTYPWKDPQARAFAASTLRRNRLYRSGNLLQQPMVSPVSAKLFICGNAEVGKTTLRKKLLTPSWRRAIADWCSFQHFRAERGMEFHSLLFRQSNGGQMQADQRPLRLVICDLAGQHEYHTFHHYFIAGSNLDLFIVVCKWGGEIHQQQDLEFQLEYWLRFIVTHRSNDSIKPKVMVVVN